MMIINRNVQEKKFSRRLSEVTLINLRYSLIFDFKRYELIITKYQVNNDLEMKKLYIS